MTVRPNLRCATQIEIPYYGSTIGRKDKCSHCGIHGCSANLELKERFKTVLPICDGCLKMEKLPFTARPYGRAEVAKK